MASATRNILPSVSLGVPGFPPITGSAQHTAPGCRTDRGCRLGVRPQRKRAEAQCEAPALGSSWRGEGLPRKPAGSPPTPRCIPAALSPSVFPLHSQALPPREVSDWAARTHRGHPSTLLRRRQCQMRTRRRDLHITRDSISTKHVTSSLSVLATRCSCSGGPGAKASD